MAARNKFERKLPEDRRKALIAATLTCLGRDGQAGLSVRKISAEAGISIGLINHHYPSKDALVAESYDRLATALLESAKEAVAQAGSDPHARLKAFCRSVLTGEGLDRESFRAWVVFWGMIGDSPALAETHDRTYQDYRAFVEKLLVDHATSANTVIPDIHLAAIGLSALLDGLWLERCLNPATFSVEEALGTCETFVVGLTK